MNNTASTLLVYALLKVVVLRPILCIQLIMTLWITLPFTGIIHFNDDPFPFQILHGLISVITKYFTK